MSPVAESLLSPSERDRALRAMATLCATRGYDETSVEEVVEAAEIDRGDFERIFDGKEDCAIEAVKAILGETMCVVGASYSPDHSEWDTALFGIKAILDLMAAHPSFAYVAYIGSRQMTPEGVREVRVSGVSLLCTMLDRLRTSAARDEQPGTAAAGAFGGAEAVVRREVARGRAERLPELLPDLIYSAVVPFLGQEDGLRLARRGRELLAGAGGRRR
jgi:AcrR family transcriptional regulator